MERRKFIINSGIAASSLMLFSGCKSLLSQDALNSIGVQLFSFPKLLEKDFNAGIKMVSEMGYKEIEMFGPFNFSVEAAKKRWNSITPMLGFNGSGYFGHTPKEIKTILDEHNIKVTSIHSDMDTMQTRMEEIAKESEQLGFEYVVLPAIPKEKRQTLDDYKRVVEEFNEIGEKAKQVGLKFAYHNHGYGLNKIENQVPIELVFDQTESDLVFFQMDLFWTIAGGMNPSDLLNAYPGRYVSMHVKDMKKLTRFSGDGGDPSQWMELFPQMASLGDGVLDIPKIISTAQQQGVKHFYIEQDIVNNPEVALKKSFNYLKSLNA
ncbi:MAG: sugar phosphate isomerase/epimerase [Flavobacteriaceae bacterium]|jgi:sugar phosphate isomerase/epimerase|nr:sugar phosphate isomerase/epimerase [Flavobacteriaceae bacterium]MDO7582119.1 sugar phosphate isomerase/epimerase [Flavobacteriaceae bacterium]MDO7598911.1 sugar phosphate isomerase/epimerase [Flavobacteriaceae bacterium]MDO7602816.1 sugar phosphate isomerase/epimerase [Flavobacteriaceae bacterium]MDO7615857.1 sugar phosphate isomerase/epimerase [Flavobacteriaceae bacterium]